MPHDGHVTYTEPRPTGRRNARLRQSVGDMVRSLVVVLAVVAALLLVTYRPQPDPVRQVDPAPMLALARAQAAFPVLAPVGIAGLRPTSVRWEVTEQSRPEPAWHIGYVTEATEYVQVGQSASTSAEYVADQTANGQRAGTRSINGEEWLEYVAPERTSLVRTSPSGTTVVSGTVGISELEAVVRALR